MLDQHLQIYSHCHFDMASHGDLYIDRLKGMPILQRRTQAGTGRTGKKLKVITASVGNCWALQNGSLILLSPHRRLAIPVSWRCPLGARLPESTPEWRRDNSEDSRMCDPFCKAQQFPTDAAISLNKLLATTYKPFSRSL